MREATVKAVAASASVGVARQVRWGTAFLAPTILGPILRNLALLALLALPWLLPAASVAAETTRTGHDMHLPTGERHALAHLAAACIDLPGVSLGSEASGAFAAGCSVSSFAHFARFEGIDYYRAHYCLWPHWLEDEDSRGCDWAKYRAAAHAIFVGPAGDSEVSVLFLESGDYTQYYDEPGILENRFGHWLHVAIVVDGTGHFNASTYHRWNGMGWSRVDSDSWLDALHAYLLAPPDGMDTGLETRKGVWPDLESMTARIALYRPNDCNACASGGFLDVQLGVEDDRFTLESVRFVPPEDEY